MENTLQRRITLDSNICHGKPCIRGLRYPVEFVLELLSSGMNTEEILEDYNDLERDDILAALLFATKLTQVSVESRCHHNSSISYEAQKLMIINKLPNRLSN